MTLEGTPEALADAQSGIREIAMGSPYERAVQGDAITQRLADTFQQAGDTPDFYGPVGEQIVTDEVVEASPLDDNMDEVIAETMAGRPPTASAM